MNEAEELRKESSEKKKELALLRQRLNSEHQEKEKAFLELKEIHQQIKALIPKINLLKNERNELTKQVKALKEERNKLNLAVKETSSAKKGVIKKKQELQDTFKLKENPAKIKMLIKALEEKLETEVMAFSKEKELNKKLKVLKEQYKEVKELDEVWKEANIVSADFSQKRKEAQERHQKIQDLAQISQEKHVKIMFLYEELKKLRGEEKNLVSKSSGLKSIYEQTKKDLESLQQKVKEISKNLNEKDQRNLRNKIKEKTAEIQEKIKAGKKLSTEDILAFQASE